MSISDFDYCRLLAKRRVPRVAAQAESVAMNSARDRKILEGEIASDPV
ncbi:hypothetical protein MBEBAB_2551 [Brevundimonas abyssalis TAR-001]|uniref:Uncharacterized protein n=1 Tax=Brevundimonas abyssalis TAR-001 TaxID=1391729 RepID=A0A8E0NDH4_9CAUL|nr:hypothetical protein MBEBAB_2551 [Brevundimonas abyssalis TAR-001]